VGAMGAIGLGVVGLVLSFVGAKHRAGIVAVLVTAAAGMAAGGLLGAQCSAMICRRSTTCRRTGIFRGLHRS